jgi:hypothetical protein
MRAILLLILPASLLAQAQPVPVTNAKPGWQWTMDSVNKVVNAVRAGRSLQPKAWPNGARVAVLLSFDVDNETVAIRFGEPTVGSLSQAEYGARTGLPRVESVGRAQDSGDVFIPSVSSAITPSMAGVIKKRDDTSSASTADSRDECNAAPTRSNDGCSKGADGVDALTGTKPPAIAPSWNFSSIRVDLARYAFAMSLTSDDRPYELMQNGKTHGWSSSGRVDSRRRAALIRAANGTRRRAKRAVDDEFDKAYDEGTMFVLTMHPHLGAPFAIIALGAAHRPHREQGRREGLVGDAR